LTGPMFDSVLSRAVNLARVDVHRPGSQREPLPQS
jgi:hypothetical protein